MKLTEEQCNEFRRHPGSFNDMVQAIFDAGLAARERETAQLTNAENVAIRRFNAGEKPTYSTGICGTMTGGYGQLDDNGYWEFPLPASMLAKPAPINSPACPTCNGAGVIGTPGASCPSCSLFALGRQFNADGAAQSQEPAAWEFELATGYEAETDTYHWWEWRTSRTKPSVLAGSIRNLRPLYRPEGLSYEASMLRNLLARIHRDGGQYTAQHGLDRSLEDADKIVSDLLAAPRDAEVTPLMRFYGVDDLAALVRAQEQHIQRLQSKLPTPRDEFPPSPRIG